jgi:hypothetical protein
MNDVPLNDKDLQLNSMIREMAQQHQPELPNPGVLWWRARIQKKMEDKRRVERPLAIMRMVAGVAGLVVVTYLILNNQLEPANRFSFSSVLLLACCLFFSSIVLYLAISKQESRT